VGANAARLGKARLNSPISRAPEVVAYEFEGDKSPCRELDIAIKAPWLVRLESSGLSLMSARIR
jgi:hypothetical protein